MKISILLATHHGILQQAWLANLACAYATLRRLAERVRRTGLQGLVRLCQPDLEAGRCWASLTALEGSQALLEELFLDEEILDFADAVAFARGTTGLDVVFRIEDTAEQFLAPLEQALAGAGITLDVGPDWPGEADEATGSSDEDGPPGADNDDPPAPPGFADPTA